MSWGRGYRNSGIRVLRDYEHAVWWFENTLPIRGRAVECRPLGHRNRPHFQIRKADDGSIQCIDYNESNIPVTFHPDGTVTLKAKWVSNSTAAFIQEVTGLGACVHDHSVRIFLAEGAYRIPTEGLKIRRKNGEGPWELVVKQVNIVHHIRRREANNVRRKPEYAAFRDYLSGVIKIKEKMFDEDECKELFGVKVHEYKTSGGETLQWQIPDVPKLYYHDRDSMQALFRMANSGDPVQMYKAVVIIAKKTCGYILNLNDILVAWDRCIIAYHKDEVLVEVELPAGALRRDQYGWAFR